MVGLSLVVLVGMFGLAVDSGQLYVNKAELQSAADACALAASQELTCQSAAAGGAAGIVTCPASFLLAAETAGVFAGGKNKARLQSSQVVIQPADVRFSTTLGPNNGYLSRANGANVNARFAMCIARANGIAPWVMGVVGAGATDVNAVGVATLAPGQSFCSAAPIGLCGKSGGAAPNFGYAVGEWITGRFTSKSGGKGGSETTDVAGSFRWVDYTPNAGGTDELREQLYGQDRTCGLKVGDDIKEPGTKQGSKFAYNARFGIYGKDTNDKRETKLTAPPDRSGYAYPNTKPDAGFPLIAVGTSAYGDYVRRQGVGSAFVNAQYNMPGTTVTGQDVVSTTADHKTYGTDRRLIPVPVIGCGGGMVPILGMACVLMLNPMSKGANGDIYLEYRGNAAAAGSPCRILGPAGGPGGNGPLVPTLVQ